MEKMSDGWSLSQMKQFLEKFKKSNGFLHLSLREN